MSKRFGEFTEVDGVDPTLEDCRLHALKGDGIHWSQERIFECFPRIRERLESKAETLCGGEQPMVANARALSGHVRVLLMDEPFEGLAPAVSEEVCLSLDGRRPSAPTASCAGRCCGCERGARPRASPPSPSASSYLRAGEIGDSKREIVFHGDVLNTTARLEQATLDLDRRFLVSTDALSRLTATERYALEPLGPQALRGRAAPVEVHAVGATRSLRREGEYGIRTSSHLEITTGTRL